MLFKNLFFFCLAGSAFDARAAGTITDLAWMAGAWTGSSDGQAIESQFSTPEGGVLLGQSRFIAPGGALTFYEFDLISEAGGHLVLTPSPFGQPGVSFTSGDIGADHIVFSNPAHAWPSEIEFRLTPEGELYTRVSGTDAGQPKTLTYTQHKGR